MESSQSNEEESQSETPEDSVESQLVIEEAAKARAYYLEKKQETQEKWPWRTGPSVICGYILSHYCTVRTLFWFMVWLCLGLGRNTFSMVRF